MPLREYECDECGAMFEDLVPLNDSRSSTPCTQCGSTNTRLLVSSCAFIMKDTGARNRHVDSLKRRNDMRRDLSENYGVESVAPVPNPENKGFDEIYRDIKMGGSLVSEKMQETRETNQRNTKKKQKEWMRGALQRAEKRGREKVERKKKAEHEKKKISLTT